MSLKNIALSQRRHKYVDAMIGLVAADKSKYNQSQFPSPALDEIITEHTQCGAVFCAAGFIAMAKSNALFQRLCDETLEIAKQLGGNFGPGSVWDVWAKAGAEILGLDFFGDAVPEKDIDDDSSAVGPLFGMVYSWPYKYRSMYASADTDQQRFVAFKGRWKAWLKASDKQLGVKWVNGVCFERSHAVSK